MNPFDSLLLTNITVTAKKENGCICGYIDNEENYQSLIAKMKRIGYNYCIRSSKSHGARCGKVLLGYQLMKSEAPIQFFGSPFQSLRTVYLHCSRGIKYYKTKAEREIEKLGNPTSSEESTRKISKKVGCPAKLVVRCVKIYPEYELKKNHWRCKDTVIKQLKSDLNAGYKPKSFLRFFVEASLSSCHNHSIPVLPKKQKWIIHKSQKEKPEDNLIPCLQELCKEHTTSILNSIDGCHDSSVLTKTLMSLNECISALKNIPDQHTVCEEQNNSYNNSLRFNIRTVCISVPYLPEIKNNIKQIER